MPQYCLVSGLLLQNRAALETAAADVGGDDRSDGGDNHKLKNGQRAQVKPDVGGLRAMLDKSF